MFRRPTPTRLEVLAGRCNLIRSFVVSKIARQCVGAN